MKVLCGPIEGLNHPNPYVKTLLRRLDDVVELDVFRWRRALFRRYDVIHLSWPEHLVASPSPFRSWMKALLLGVIVLRAKALKTKLVWTVHNDTPHEERGLGVELAFSLWQRRTDGAIFLTETGREAYSFPRRAPVEVVIRHGDYTSELPEGGLDAIPPRRRGGAPYLIFFGLIRPYKGLDQVIQAMARSHGCFDLLIAGRADDQQHLDHIQRLAAVSPRIEVDPRYVPEPELVELIAGSAGVVLPYTRMNNSGALLLALTLGKPVLVPEGPTNREIAGLVGPGWIELFESPLQPDDLERFFRSASRPRHAPPDLSAFGWDDVVDAHESLYRKLVGASTLATPRGVGTLSRRARHTKVAK